MYFSTAYNIKNPLEEDWFDISLDRDTCLFIDPMLVFQTDKSDFINCAGKIKGFFNEAFKRVAVLKGTSKIVTDQKLQKMLEFREPKELCLGFTQYGSSGSGIGKDFSEKIRNAMVELLELGLEEFGEYLSPFEMFVEGIGADRIGDIMGNLMKEDLIKYTQKICKKRNIPMKKFMIDNIRYDNNLGWIRNKVDLPFKPHNKKPIILVPKDFLITITTSHLDREDFLEYILHIENSELRKQATRLFTMDLSKKSLREAIRRDPHLTKELLTNYMRKREKEKAKPYDFRNDPELINELPKLIESLSNRVKGVEVDSFTFDDLLKFTNKVIEEFKFQVESNEGYRVLFDDKGNPRKERISQILFWNIASTICRGTGGLIDINPESQTGRGPVDFKFSRGYNKRIIIELKLAKSKAIYDGMQKQLTEYLKSDEVDMGFYVVIKTLPRDHARVAELIDRYEKKLELPNKKQINLIVINASKDSKISASKIR